jgi:hypothetical protein
MADFIVDDDDEDDLALKELRKVTKGLGPRENHDYDSASSDMEARHDEIEEEER